MQVSVNLFMVSKPVDDGLKALLYELQAGSDSIYETMKVGDMHISDWSLFDNPHPLIAKQKRDFSRICAALLGAPVNIFNAWFHVYRSGSAFKRHNHLMPGKPGELQFAMSYYVSRGDDNGTGQLKLYNPDIVIHPKDGMLVMFPSSVDHEVLEYRGESDRIMIGCNLERAPPAR